MVTALTAASVVTAYEPSRWSNLFLGELGAAAALVGLLFVAISINLERILAYAWLPGRAAETLVFLVNVLVVATFGLVPDQSARALGWEVLAVGGIVWLGLLAGQVRARRHYQGRPGSWFAVRVLITQAATLPFVLAGISLVAGGGGGCYWLVVATIAAVLAALENSWVLLVEIVR